MICPTNATSFSEAMKMGTETYHALKNVIKKKYGIDGMLHRISMTAQVLTIRKSPATNVGDEGGFAPNVSGAEEALDLLVEAIKIAGHEGRIKIAMDPASSEFYDEKEKKYDLDFKNTRDNDGSKKITGKELAELYTSYVEKYPIIMIEDPFDEDDWEAWSHFTSNTHIEIVGDDLLATNVNRIKIAIEKKACNGLLLKVEKKHHKVMDQTGSYFRPV